MKILKVIIAGLFLSTCYTSPVTAQEAITCYTLENFYRDSTTARAPTPIAIERHLISALVNAYNNIPPLDEQVGEVDEIYVTNVFFRDIPAKFLVYFKDGCQVAQIAIPDPAYNEIISDRNRA